MTKKIIFLILVLTIPIGIFVINKWFVRERSVSLSKTPVKTHLTQIQPVKSHSAVFTSKVLFIGDIMLARTIGQRIISGTNPFKHVQGVLDTYNIRVANIETTIAEPVVSQQVQGKLFTFNAPVVAIQILKRATIDIAVLANNHTRDFGASATSNMIDNLQNAGIKVAGAGKNIDQAFKPVVVDVPALADNTNEEHPQMVRLAIVAVNKIENSYTNATTSTAGTAFFDKDRVVVAIKSAREVDKADIVVVFPHWGVEYQTQPNSDQIDWGRFFIDTGADIVIGSHPHVVQTTENYRGKYIVYSLGNFIFDGMGGNALNGQMIGLEIKLQGKVNDQGILQDGTKSVTLGSPNAIPTHINIQGFPEIK